MKSEILKSIDSWKGQRKKFNDDQQCFKKSNLFLFFSFLYIGNIAPQTSCFVNHPLFSFFICKQLVFGGIVISQRYWDKCLEQLYLINYFQLISINIYIYIYILID